MSTVLLCGPFQCYKAFVSRSPDGTADFEIKVIFNRELERVFLGFGENLQVLSPEDIRKVIISRHSQAAEGDFLPRPLIDNEKSCLRKGSFGSVTSRRE